jgi:hypothetical protein
MQTYHDVCNSLPIGMARTPRHTWVVSLLPQVEQTALFEIYEQKLGFWQPPNIIISSTDGLMDKQVPVFFCPSDRKGYWRGDQYWRTRGNYVVNFGNTRAVAGADSAPFAFDRSFRLKDITDGLSNTLFLAEVIMSLTDGAWDCRGDIYNDDDGAFFATVNTPNSGVDGCVICTPTAGIFPPPCVAVPAPWPRFNNSASSPAVSSRSMHPGGVLTVLGDGAVRFVSNDVALGVWQAAGSSGGGESDRLP